jgi:hypothetical protein
MPSMPWRLARYCTHSPGSGPPHPLAFLALLLAETRREVFTDHHKHRRLFYCARYAGASVCVTKSSKRVGVVLRALRASTDFTRPSLNALAIST